MLKLDCCFITDSGKIRTNNEDNFFICGTYKRTPEELRYRKKDFVYRGGIFAVCDGMGGEEFGEKASLISVEELINFKIRFRNRILHMFSYKNDLAKQGR